MTHPLVTPPSGPPVHQARLLVSVELIHEMLKMPRATRIVGASFDGRTFDFRLEDPRIQATEEGHELPQIEPLYTSCYLPAAGAPSTMLVQAAWIFEDSTETTGDPFPDDDLNDRDDDVTEKELVAHDHVRGSTGTPRRCEICGFPS